MKSACVVLIVVAATLAQSGQRPVVPESGKFFPIPNAVVQPDRGLVYKALFDATRAADDPKEFVPALDDAASLVNELAASGVPEANRKMTIVFHGAAAYGVMDNATYREKYGVDNPNLQLVNNLRHAGVELLVCGQMLRFKNIDERKILPAVKVATDALVVSVTYQNRGYALLTY